MLRYTVKNLVDKMTIQKMTGGFQNFWNDIKKSVRSCKSTVNIREQEILIIICGKIIIMTTKSKRHSRNRIKYDNKFINL
ncbi:MAG: hypothetical protein JWP81_4797 [Ferruginibacter sp.]|nr:hypothetical protein [Ferruginibacter sp.]